MSTLRRGVLVALCVLLPAGAVALPAPATAQVVGAAGTRVVFASARTGDFEIYVMQFDGSGVTRLTINPLRRDYAPAWSPDESRVVFTSDRDGNDEIYIMNADGSNPTRLTNNPGGDTDATWSPDGTRIAFTSSRGGNDDIYTMKADGTDVRRLTNDASSDGSPDWSPDGSVIAFTRTWDVDGSSVYLINANGSNERALSSMAPGTLDFSPAWSSTGAELAFVSGRGGNLDVWVMGSSGTNARNVTDSPGDDYSPTWSGDDSQLAFTSVRTNDPEIFVTSADGTNQRNITSSAGSDGYADWGRHEPGVASLVPFPTVELPRIDEDGLPGVDLPAQEAAPLERETDPIIRLAVAVGNTALDTGQGVVNNAGRDLYGMGNNRCGQLGDGTTTSRSTATPVLTVPAVAAVDAGGVYDPFYFGTHTVALTLDKRVYAWGCNQHGQLGDGTTTGREQPVLLSAPVGVTAVAAGADHTLALDGAGNLWAWGRNYSGQLGDGTYTARTSPVMVLSDVESMDAGWAFSVAVKKDHTLWVWGHPVAQGAPSGPVPQQVNPPDFPPIAKVSAGGAHVLAIDTNKAVWAFGSRFGSPLGDGISHDSACSPYSGYSCTAQTNQYPPVRATGLSDPVEDVAAGYQSSMARTTAGTVYTWGRDWATTYSDNWDYQLRHERAPRALLGLPAKAIAAGSVHRIVLVGDTVYGWGSNTGGQLGGASTEWCSLYQQSGQSECQADRRSTTPQPIPGLEGVDLIAAGGTTTFAATLLPQPGTGPSVDANSATYSVHTTYGTYDVIHEGALFERPMQLNVDNDADFELQVELRAVTGIAEATLGASESTYRLIVTPLPGTPAPLPILVEALVAAPGRSATYVLGYDARTRVGETTPNTAPDRADILVGVTPTGDLRANAYTEGPGPVLRLVGGERRPGDTGFGVQLALSDAVPTNVELAVRRVTNSAHPELDTAITVRSDTTTTARATYSTHELPFPSERLTAVVAATLQSLPAGSVLTGLPGVEPRKTLGTDVKVTIDGAGRGFTWDTTADIAQFDVERTETVEKQGHVPSLLSHISGHLAGLPGNIKLTRASAGEIDIAVPHGEIDELEVGVAFGRNAALNSEHPGEYVNIETFKPETNEPTECDQAATVTKEPCPDSYAMRFLGLRGGLLDVTDQFLHLDFKHARGMARLDVSGEMNATGSIDLPSNVSLDIRPSDQRVEYVGSEPAPSGVGTVPAAIDDFDLSITGSAGDFSQSEPLKRVTLASITLKTVPSGAALSFTASPGGSGLSLCVEPIAALATPTCDTDPSLKIDRATIYVSSGRPLHTTGTQEGLIESEQLAVADDAIVNRDMPSEFLLLLRFSGLRSASMQKATRNVSWEGQYGYVERETTLNVDTGGGAILRLRTLSPGVDDKPETYLRATLDRLINGRVTLSTKELEFPPVNHPDTGVPMCSEGIRTEMSYSTTPPTKTSSLKLETNGGCREFMEVTLGAHANSTAAQLPESFSSCKSVMDNYCMRNSADGTKPREGNKGSSFFVASTRTTLNMFDCVESPDADPCHVERSPVLGSEDVNGPNDSFTRIYGLSFVGLYNDVSEKTVYRPTVVPPGAVIVAPFTHTTVYLDTATTAVSGYVFTRDRKEPKEPGTHNQFHGFWADHRSITIETHPEVFGSPLSGTPTGQSYSPSGVAHCPAPTAFYAGDGVTLNMGGYICTSP